jgi:hypothetical protein
LSRIRVFYLPRSRVRCILFYDRFLRRNPQLTGSIPTELGELTKLFQLSLEGNDLHGAIPGSLSNTLLLSPTTNAMCRLGDNSGLCQSGGASSKVADWCRTNSLPMCEAPKVPFQTPIAADQCDTGIKIAGRTETIKGSCIPKKRCNKAGRPYIPFKCMKEEQKYDICCFN